MFLGVRALLRCPKFFYVLERRKILTATPFYTHCIRHRRRSYKMPVTNLSTTPNLINFSDFYLIKWRRGRDSNPCGVSPKRFSRPPRYDHFDTSPNGPFYIIITHIKSQQKLLIFSNIVQVLNLGLCSLF